MRLVKNEKLMLLLVELKFMNVKRRKQECMNQDVGYVVIRVSVRRR